MESRTKLMMDAHPVNQDPAPSALSPRRYFPSHANQEPLAFTEIYCETDSKIHEDNHPPLSPSLESQSTPNIRTHKVKRLNA